ncbi:MAG: PspA/IM30 family protein [Myxacorys californica WJT36-NPBG1]|nr:PspA/IM30 family protein [Myxacorys californica WJT36-NPBG1]
MAAGGAVVGLGLVGLNRLLGQGIDPEKLLDSAIEQMEAQRQNVRPAILNAMASQKRLQQMYEQSQAEVNTWERRAQLALQKGDEFLAQQALSRKKMHAGILSSLEVQCNQEPAWVKNLKQNLVLLEAKISEAKTMRTRLKAQLAAAKVDGHLQGMVSNMGTNTALAAFERMEDKVLQSEARAQAAGELAGADLESQLARLESGDVDLELEAMKQQMLAGSAQPQAALPGQAAPQTQTHAPKDAAIDSELEDLKRQLDQL